MTLWKAHILAWFFLVPAIIFGVFLAAQLSGVFWPPFDKLAIGLGVLVTIAILLELAISWRLAKMRYGEEDSTEAQSKARYLDEAVARMAQEPQGDEIHLIGKR